MVNSPGPPARPVIHEADRARVLVALDVVDGVILFDDDIPLELIRTLRPDILVKGSDYREDQVVGGENVKSWGDRVALVDLLQGRSTTGTIAAMERVWTPRASQRKSERKPQREPGMTATAPLAVDPGLRTQTWWRNVAGRRAAAGWI